MTAPDAAIDPATAPAPEESWSRSVNLELRDVRVDAVRYEAEGVVSLELVSLDGEPLPDWQPGAHVDLVLESGLVRQYSLCGQPDADRYLIAVLRETEGRGGSAEIHDTALVGRTLRLKGPRNHFPLKPAEHRIFIAGGIGITPILSMVQSLEATDDYRLIYGGRSRESMAFVEKLRVAAGPRLTLIPQDHAGLIDLDAVLDGVEVGTEVYCCGPGPLLDAVSAAVSRHPGLGALHMERFASAAPTDNPATTGRSTGTGREAGGESKNEGRTAFEVELRQSGQTLQVGADQELIDVVLDACPALMTSCEEGFCGTCETKVLEGIPEHNDTILSDKERGENKTMMVCVGRSKTPRLVLDL